MRCPRLSELPPPPPGKTGWPWTEESEQLPDTMPDPSASSRQVPWPRVSIVTPSYNQGQFLEETIRSVLLQGYPNLEYIIIDGRSTDGSVNIIRKYDAWLVYWVSEPDDGIADAWNKGLSVCTGDIIGILNAGDWFALASLSLVAGDMPLSRPMVSYGETRVTDELGKVIKVVPGNFNRNRLYAGIGFLHPGVFATQSAYEKIGWFDTTYRYAMDCDWILRCYRRDVEFRRLGNICYMRAGGVSDRFQFAAYGEYLHALKDNGCSSLGVSAAMAYLGMRSFARNLIRQIKWRSINGRESSDS